MKELQCRQGKQAIIKLFEIQRTFTAGDLSSVPVPRFKTL